MVLTEILEKIRIQLQDKSRDVFDDDDELKYALNRAVSQMSRIQPKYTTAEKDFPDDVSGETLAIASSTGTCAYFPIKDDSETITGKTKDTDYTINYRTGVVTEVGSNLTDGDYTISYDMDKRMCYIGDIIDDPIQVKRLEYPTGNSPATMIDFEYFDGVIFLKGDNTFSAERLLRIQYTTPYSAPTDEGEGDYPDHLDYPLIIGSSGIATLSKSEYYLHQAASNVADSATVAAEIGDLSAPTTSAAAPSAPTLTSIAIPTDLVLANIDTAPADADLPSAPTTAAAPPNAPNLTDIAIPTDLILSGASAIATPPTSGNLPSAPSISGSASMPSDASLAALSMPSVLDLSNAAWRTAHVDVASSAPTAPTLSTATPPTAPAILIVGDADYITPPTFDIGNPTDASPAALVEPTAPTPNATAPTKPDLLTAGKNLHDADVELSVINANIDSALLTITSGAGDDVFDIINAVNAGADVAANYAKVAIARGELAAKYALAAAGWIDSAKAQISNFAAEVDAFRSEVQQELAEAQIHGDEVRYQGVVAQNNAVLVNNYQAMIQEETMELNDYVADINLYNARITAIINQYRSEVDSYLSQVNRDNALVAKYAQQVNSWRGAIEQYLGQLTAEVNNYKAQVEAQALTVQDNNSDVANYSAQINAYRAYVENFVADLEKYKSQLTSWGAELTSYNYQITNAIADFRTQVEASMAIATNNNYIVGKYANEVDSYVAEVSEYNIDAVSYSHEVNAWAQKLASYNYQLSHAITNFRSQVEASMAIVNNNNHMVGKYASEVNSYAVEVNEYNADVTKYSVQVQAKGGEVQGLAKSAEMYFTLYSTMQQRGNMLLQQFYAMIGMNAETQKAYTAFLQN